MDKKQVLAALNEATYNYLEPIRPWMTAEQKEKYDYYYMGMACAYEKMFRSLNGDNEETEKILNRNYIEACKKANTERKKLKTC